LAASHNEVLEKGTVFDMKEKLSIIVVLTCFMVVTTYQMVQQPVTTTTDFVRAQEREDDITVSEDAVRIRIIPHSNAYQDQLAKKMVSMAIDELLMANEEALSNIESTRLFIGQHMNEIHQRVNVVLDTINYSEDVEVTYGAHLFPEKVFNGEYLPAGYYESLVIRIGEGRGSNWWCFINPGMCLGPNLSEVNDTEYWNQSYETKELTQSTIREQNFTSYLSRIVETLLRSETETQMAKASETDPEFDWFLFEDER